MTIGTDQGAANHGPAPTANPTNTEGTCAVCLTVFQPPDPHDPTFNWPCCGHPLHFSCAANLRAHNASPTCPSCRQCWVATLDEELQTRCSRHGLLIPDPSSIQPPNHPGPQPPPRPTETTILCCHRLILTDPHLRCAHRRCVERTPRQANGMVAHLQLVRRHMASRMDVPQVRLQPTPCCKMSRPRPSVHNTGRPAPVGCRLSPGGARMGVFAPPAPLAMPPGTTSASSSPQYPPTPVGPGTTGQPRMGRDTFPLVSTRPTNPAPRGHQQLALRPFAPGGNPSARAHHGRNLGHTPGRTQWLERRVATSAPSSPDPLQHITRAAGQHLAAPEANFPAQLQRRGNQLPNNALIHLAWAVDLFMQPSGSILRRSSTTFLTGLFRAYIYP